MNLLFYRVDKEDFDYFLQSSDLIMCKRNFYSAYNDFFVLLSAEGHLEAACVIKSMDDNNFYIKCNFLIYMLIIYIFINICL